VVPPQIPKAIWFVMAQSAQTVRTGQPEQIAFAVSALLAGE